MLAGKKKIILEKPIALRRVFFSARVIASQAQWYDMKISFDDPTFFYFYSLNGPEKYFEATGVDIFQGKIWAMNNSDTNLTMAVTEILH